MAGIKKKKSQTGKNRDRYVHVLRVARVRVADAVVDDHLAPDEFPDQPRGGDTRHADSEYRLAAIAMVSRAVERDLGVPQQAG